MAKKSIFAGLLFCCALAQPWLASAEGLPETLGMIDRYDAAAKRVYIAGVGYQLRGEALETLSSYQEQTGIGSLKGQRIAYRFYQNGRDGYYIDLITLIPSQ